MPSKNFISVTMKKDSYAKIKEKFENNKNSLNQKGINSVSAYMTHVIGQDVDESEKLKILANKITKMPEFIRIPKEYLPTEI
jgi:hypothetical protein